MAEPLRLKAKARPGSATVTVGRLNQAGPRRPLFLALNRAPTTGPATPLAQVHRTHSGLHCPMRVMSETRACTCSGGAPICVETASWVIRLGTVASSRNRVPVVDRERD